MQKYLALTVFFLLGNHFLPAEAEIKDKSQNIEVGEQLNVRVEQSSEKDLRENRPSEISERHAQWLLQNMQLDRQIINMFALGQKKKWKHALDQVKGFAPEALIFYAAIGATMVRKAYTENARTDPRWLENFQYEITSPIGIFSFFCFLMASGQTQLFLAKKWGPWSEKSLTNKRNQYVAKPIKSNQKSYTRTQKGFRQLHFFSGQLGMAMGILASNIVMELDHVLFNNPNFDVCWNHITSKDTQMASENARIKCDLLYDELTSTAWTWGPGILSVLTAAIINHFFIQSLVKTAVVTRYAGTRAVQQLHKISIMKGTTVSARLSKIRLVKNLLWLFPVGWKINGLKTVGHFSFRLFSLYSFMEIEQMITHKLYSPLSEEIKADDLSDQINAFMSQYQNLNGKNEVPLICDPEDKNDCRYHDMIVTFHKMGSSFTQWRQFQFLTADMAKQNWLLYVGKATSAIGGVYETYRQFFLSKEQEDHPLHSKDGIYSAEGQGFVDNVNNYYSAKEEQNKDSGLEIEFYSKREGRFFTQKFMDSISASSLCGVELNKTDSRLLEKIKNIQLGTSKLEEEFPDMGMDEIVNEMPVFSRGFSGLSFVFHPPRVAGLDLDQEIWKQICDRPRNIPLDKRSAISAEEFHGIFRDIKGKSYNNLWSLSLDHLLSNQLPSTELFEQWWERKLSPYVEMFSRTASREYQDLLKQHFLGPLFNDEKKEIKIQSGVVAEDPFVLDAVFRLSSDWFHWRESGVDSWNPGNLSSSGLFRSPKKTYQLQLPKGVFQNIYFEMFYWLDIIIALAEKKGIYSITDIENTLKNLINEKLSLKKFRTENPFFGSIQLTNEADISKVRDWASAFIQDENYMENIRTSIAEIAIPLGIDMNVLREKANPDMGVLKNSILFIEESEQNKKIEEMNDSMTGAFTYNFNGESKNEEGEAVTPLVDQLLNFSLIRLESLFREAYDYAYTTSLIGNPALTEMQTEDIYQLSETEKVIEGVPNESMLDDRQK